jgi:hypothetical protein
VRWRLGGVSPVQLLPLRAFGSALESRGVDLDGNGYEEAFFIILFLKSQKIVLIKNLNCKNIYIYSKKNFFISLKI